MFHLSNLIARTISVGAVVGSIALSGLSAAASFAQEADVERSPGALLVQDTKSSTGPAQSPMPGSGAKQPRSDPVAARIIYLHDTLQITAAQEPLWTNVAQVMRENAQAAALLIEERAKNAESVNAVDNLDSYERLGQAQLEGVRKFSAAFQALYASLSDDQKKIADAILREGPLSMFGGALQPPERFVAPVPYPSYPTLPLYPSYPYAPPYAYYAPYPYYSSYWHYPFYRPWFWGPPVGLGASFFFIHRHPHRPVVLLPPRPVARKGVPVGRSGVVRHH